MTRRTRQIIAAVIVPLALLVALLAWALSSPPGSSPDDDYHMGSIWCAQGEVEDRCEFTEDQDIREIPADVAGAAACFAFNGGQAATCPLDGGSLTPSHRGNWYDNGYPPVFYATMSAFVSEDLSASIVTMRAVNVAIFLVVLCALFWLLPSKMKHVLVWGTLIGIVPLGMFLIPSVNPSSWAILQASGLWLSVWGFFEQSGKKKLGLAVVATALMVIGAGARGDAAAYGVVALAVAVVLGWRRDRRFLVELILPLGLAAIAAGFFLSSGQSGVLTAETTTGTSDLFTLIVATLQNLPLMWIGALGFSVGFWGLGWLDTPMPALVWVTSVVLFGAVIFWGLRRGNAQKWLALIGVAAALILVPSYILVREGLAIGHGVQPRYVYPLMIIFVGVALVGARRADLGMSRLQLAVIAVGLGVANSLALHTNMRRYITGLDGRGINLDRDAEWWWNMPVSPMTIWIAGSIAFFIAVAALAWFAATTERASRLAALASQPAQST